MILFFATHFVYIVRDTASVQCKCLGMNYTSPSINTSDNCIATTMAMRAVTKIEIQCQRRRPYHETVETEFKTGNDIDNDSQNESEPAAGIDTQIESLHENKLKPKLELERKSKAKRRFKTKP